MTSHTSVDYIFAGGRTAWLRPKEAPDRHGIPRLDPPDVGPHFNYHVMLSINCELQGHGVVSREAPAGGGLERLSADAPDELPDSRARPGAT
ncbi:hypothetical protein DL771_007433 [Monosporascus sp. 5C6A]|nr:hypothetical protein DL771_007433 [Monosporascus sp. 5C6A]